MRDAVNSGEVEVGLVNHYYLYEKIAAEGADAVVAVNQYAAPGDPGGLVNVAGVGVLEQLRQPGGRAGTGRRSCSAKTARTTSPTKTFEYPLVDGRRRRRRSAAARRARSRPTIDLADLDSLAATQELLAGRRAAHHVTRTTVATRAARARRRPLAARRRRRPSPVVPSALLAVMSVAPIWYLVDRVVEQGWSTRGRRAVAGRTLDLVLRSLALAATVTAACIVIGVAAAWLVVRSDLPGRRVLRVALALPLAVPSYLSAFAWVSWRPALAGLRRARRWC